MTNIHILVTGATGNIGGRVVKHLLDSGALPKLFVRDVAKARRLFGEGVDIAAGDLENEGDLTAALDEIDALFLVSDGPRLATHDAVAARVAHDAGVARLVKLSSLGARATGTATAVAAWHASGEEAIRASGVPFTFVRSVGFMSNALAWARSIKASGVVRASTGEGRIAMIHPDDLAAVACEALIADRSLGEVLTVTGPEALTYGEMTAAIASAIGRPLTFVPLSDAQAHAGLLAAGLAPDLADALVILWREVREGLVSLVTDDVARTLGRPALSFDTWIRQNAAAFTSVPQE